jgi:hypothetical protein
MKSTLDVINVTETPTFPALYRNKHSLIVVLFRTPTSGMVVYSPITDYSVGDMDDDWTNCIVPGMNWERVPSGTKITLEQD